MLVSPASLLQQQSGKRVPRKDGLKNGLKSLGWGRIPVDFAGTKKEPYGSFFNDLQTSVDVYRS
jgi:hypothetical protein